MAKVIGALLLLGLDVDRVNTVQCFPRLLRALSSTLDCAKPSLTCEESPKTDAFDSLQLHKKALVRAVGYRALAIAALAAGDVATAEVVAGRSRAGHTSATN